MGLQGRAFSSSNWRATSTNKGLIQSKDKPSDGNLHSRDFSQQTWHNTNIQNVSSLVINDSLRGEDDERTLQAINEGRRLYVGNLPYRAQVQDVKDVFTERDYNM